MTRLVVAVDMDGAAFDGSLGDAGRELTRILAGVVQRFADGQADGKLLDLYGNTTGWWAVRYGLDQGPTHHDDDRLPVTCPECGSTVMA
jgi:hypothetical protein